MFEVVVLGGFGGNFRGGFCMFLPVMLIGCFCGVRCFDCWRVMLCYVILF